jgi:MoaA/NifB/PqqE/SkfB family radical SAM enzyme
VNTTWGGLSKKIVESAKEKKVPLIGTFELNARCNLACKMCYVNRPAHDPEALSKELTASQWIALAKEARDAGMLYLLLTGGEVFLRPDLKEICEEISKLGIVLSIYTNATLITQIDAKWLSKIPLLDVSVTLYGASNLTYQTVCGNADAYDSAFRGIDFLRSEGITLSIRLTVVKSNQEDYQSVANFASENKIHFGVVNYISPRKDCMHI